MLLMGIVSLSPISRSSFGEGAPSKGAINAAFLSQLEKELIEEINFARKYPQSYQSLLEKNRTYYRGKRLEIPGKIPVVTKEGLPALNEAIRYLNTAPSAPALILSHGMSLGARDHVRDQQSGSAGHFGRDGSNAGSRVNRYGAWRKSIGENIEYGSDDARSIVTNMIIDDGVSDRGHRTNLFNPDFRMIGVACGPHRVYRSMCVFTFAGAYSEKAGPSD
jgi:hypothetical protein